MNIIENFTNIIIIIILSMALSFVINEAESSELQFNGDKLDCKSMGWIEFDHSCMSREAYEEYLREQSEEPLCTPEEEEKAFIKGNPERCTHD